MASILDDGLRNDVDQLKFLISLMNEYDLYQKEISALSTVGFMAHVNMEMNDGVLYRSNQAIKESHVITAKRLNSLYKHAREVDIFPKFAIPASMKFILIIQEGDFIANATKNGDVYTYNITTENMITAGSFIYSLDYDINIRLEIAKDDSRYITARYLLQGVTNPISDLVNPTIKIIRQKNMRGYEYHLYLELKQYHREFVSNSVTNRDYEVFHVSTKRNVDQLAAMDVFHISSRNSTTVRLNQKMFFESSRTDADTIFVQFNDANNLRLVHKSQQGGFRPVVGDTIFTTLYVTTGNGANVTYNFHTGENIKFRYAEGNDLFVRVYIPDRESIGGITYNESKESLRKNIIVKKSTRDSIVIENDLYMILNNRVEDNYNNFNKYVVIKNRNDILKLFNIFTTLNFTKNNDNTNIFTIPTNTLDVEWNFVDDGVLVDDDFYALDKMYVGSNVIAKGSLFSKPDIESSSNTLLKYRVPYLLYYDKKYNMIRTYENHINERYECEYNLINSNVPYSYICNWVKLKKDDYYDALDIEFQVRINITGETPKEPIIVVDPVSEIIQEGTHMNIFFVLYDENNNEIFRKKATFKAYDASTDDDYFTYGLRLIEANEMAILRDKVKLINPSDGSDIWIDIEKIKGAIEIITNSEKSPGSTVLDINPSIINRFTFTCDLVNNRSTEFKIQHSVLGNNRVGLYQLPVVEKVFYDTNKDTYRDTIKKEYNMRNYLSKYQGEFSFSYKYVNTYGFSNTYSIGLDKKDLNNVVLDMAFIVEKAEGSTITEEQLNQAINGYLSTINFLDYEEFHISRLYEFILDAYPNGIKLIQFKGMNGYNETDQLISSKIREIKNDTIIENLALPIVYDKEKDTFKYKCKWTFR